MSQKLTDLCESCELQKSFSNDSFNSETLEKFDNHLADKIATKLERDQVRTLSLNENQGIVCFDLQKKFQCPRANVSNFFYKRKLNVYNLRSLF